MQYVYNPPIFLKISSVITLAVSLIGTIIIYAISISNSVTVAEYYAFNSAYGMVNSAFLALAGIASGLASIKPILEMAKPIMETVPETSEDRRLITRLTGKIELNNVTFQYKDNDQMILDNLSLTIHPGQYVAIVGKTGCGKSTLLRIMLGFEPPKRALYTMTGMISTKQIFALFGEGSEQFCKTENSLTAIFIRISLFRRHGFLCRKPGTRLKLRGLPMISGKCPWGCLL